MTTNDCTILTSIVSKASINDILDSLDAAGVSKDNNWQDGSTTYELDGMFIKVQADGVFITSQTD